MAKIYVASSWRNVFQQDVVAILRDLGHEVYDFKNPPHGNGGFQWSDIDPDWQNWTTEQYQEALNHPIAQKGFDSDFNGMQWDAKHNFNTAIAAIRRLKQDVDKTQFSTQENFGDDSDCLLAFIKMLIDRCGDDDKEEVAEKLAKCGMVVVQDETFYVEPKKEDQAS